MMTLNRKNKLLIGGFIIVLLICYQFAFSNTLEYYRQYSAEKEKAEASANNSQTLARLKEKDRQLSTALAGFTLAGNEAFQNNLLKAASKWSKQYGLTITGFNEPHVFQEKDTRTLHYTFSVQGSFGGTLLLVNNIENTPSLGFVRHLSFEKRKNYKTGTEYLATEIVLAKNESLPQEREQPDN